MRRLFLILDDRFAAPGRVLVLGGALLLVAISVLIAIFLIAFERQSVTVVPLPSSADSSQVTLAPASDGPAGEVAGSRRLVVNFDALATNSEIDGWDVTDGARFITAVQPTAVDRSARLQNGTACHALDVDVAELYVTFMVDRITDGAVAAMTLELRDGTVLGITIDNGQATAVNGAEPVTLEAGQWYGWSLAFGAEELRAEILAPDGTVLAEDTAVAASDARVIDLCLMAGPSIGLYLSDLAVGTR